METLQSITEIIGLNECSFAIFSPNSLLALLRRFCQMQNKRCTKTMLVSDAQTKSNEAIHFNSFYNQSLRKGIFPW